MAKENDFDKEDKGRYKPNPNRHKIIESLGAKLYQSSRHLCQNTGVSIDDVLEIVEGDAAIDYKFVSGVMVYFLRENEPEGTLYNTGNNSFGIKPPEKNTVDKKSKDGRSANKPPRVKESVVKAELVEKFALEGLSVEETAAALGVAPATFKTYLYAGKRPEIKQAWDNGKQRRRDLVATAKPEAPVGGFGDEKIAHSSIPVTDAEDEAFEAIAQNQEDLAEILELSDEAFEERFQPEAETDLLEIPKRLNGRVVQHGSRMNHPVVRDLMRTPVLSEFAVAVVEETERREFAPETAFQFDNQIAEAPAHFRTVTLSNGKKIFMSDDINIFDLKPDEARFCAEIVKLIDEFESARKS